MVAWAIEIDDCHVILIRLADGRNLLDYDLAHELKFPEQVRPHAQTLPLEHQLQPTSRYWEMPASSLRRVYGHRLGLRPRYRVDGNTGAFRFASVERWAPLKSCATHNHLRWQESCLRSGHV